MTRKASDIEILNGLQQEESWAYKALYEDFFKLVNSYVTRNSGNQEDSKDIFQDTIIALHRLITKKDFVLKENTKLSTLIFAIAKRLWLSKIRGSKLKLINEDIGNMDYQFQSDEEEIVKKREIETVHVMIKEKFEELGQECRQLLNLYYFKKEKMKKIAEVMNYSEGFVRVKKNRCMNELKKML